MKTRLALGFLLMLAASPAWTKKMDCSAINKKTKKSLTLGFKASFAFLASAGPEVTYGTETSMGWNDIQQDLARRYVEICIAYNGGVISKQEYNRRWAEIDKLNGKAQQLMTKMQKERAAEFEKRVKKVKAEAKDAFAALDREVKQRRNSSGAETVETKEPVIKASREVSTQFYQLARDIKAAAPKNSVQPAKPSEPSESLENNENPGDSDTKEGPASSGASEKTSGEDAP